MTNDLFDFLRYLRVDSGLAVRRIRRRPTSFCSVVVTLAVALGPAVLVFGTYVNTISQSLYYRAPSQIIVIDDPELANIDVFDPSTFDGSRIILHTSDALTPYHTVGVNLTGRIRQRLEAAIVGPKFMGILGVTPLLGRDFKSQEYTPGSDHVVLLSYRLWSSHFSKDKSVLGQAITIDGLSFSIIGVLPNGVTFPDSADIYIPSAFDLSILHNSGTILPRIVGRLKSGSSLSSIRAELLARQRISGSLRDSHLATATVQMFSDALSRPIKNSLIMLSMIVVSLFCIAFTNAAFLMLTHTNEELYNINILISLGAPRFRLLQAALVYIALTFGASAACGIVSAELIWVVGRSTAGMFPDVRIVVWNLPLILVTFTCTLLVGCLATCPSLMAMRHRHSISRHGKTVASQRISGNLLLLVSVSLSTALMGISDSLLVSVLQTSHSSLGFSLTNVAMASVTLDGKRYRFPGPTDSFVSEALRRMRSNNLITVAAATSSPPFAASPSAFFNFVSEDRRQLVSHVSERIVTPDYFKTMKIKVLEGREFSAADTTRSVPVAIVSGNVAQSLWPFQSAIGHHLRQDRSDSVSLLVVGVVASVRDYGPTQPEVPMLYSPLSQNVWQDITFMAGTKVPASSLEQEIKQAIEQSQPDVVTFGLQPLAEKFINSERTLFLLYRVTSVLSVLSLFLLGLGSYALARNVVNARAKEVAVKLALGCQRSRVMAQITGELVVVGMFAIVLGTFGEHALRYLIGRVYLACPPLSLPLEMLNALIIFSILMISCVPSFHAMLRLDLTNLLKVED